MMARIFLKFFAFFLAFLALRASEPNWSDKSNFSLAKDEVKSGQIFVHGASMNFRIHWDLNKIHKGKSTGLVVIANLDGFNYHFVLTEEINQNIYTLKLASVDDYVMIVLKSFENNRANFFIGASGAVRLSL